MRDRARSLRHFLFAIAPHIPTANFAIANWADALRLDWWTNWNLKFRGLLERRAALRQKAFVMWVLLPQMLPRAHLPTVVRSVKSWSGRRDSNPRHRAWQGCAPSFRFSVAASNHRTETEHLATILLPNPVVTDGPSRHVMDDAV